MADMNSAIVKRLCIKIKPGDLNMSRSYLISVEVRKPDPTRLREIEIAAEKEWPFDEWIWLEDQKLISSFAESSLSGGEDEKEFAGRLTKAIWKANGQYCQALISATCLDDLPTNLYELTEVDFADWSKQSVFHHPNPTLQSA